jgi:hypothetical protein
MNQSLAVRWLNALDRRRLVARLLLAWLLCTIPRLAFTLIMGPSQDYQYFRGAPLNSYWYPLYSWIAGFFWILSQGSVPVYVGLHLVIHALIGPAVYLLATQLGFSRAGAWCSVAASGLLPYYVSIAARQANVGILIVLLAATLLSFVLWINRGFLHPLGGFCATISFLLLALRPNALSTIAFLYGLAVIVAWRGRGETPSGALRRRLWSVGLSVAVFLILVGLQAWGNGRRTGHFTPFTPNHGYNLYVGNNPHVLEYAARYDIMSLESAVLDTGLPGEVAAASDPYIRDRILARIALEYMLADPLRTLRHALVKSLRYWDFRMERAATLPWFWNAALALPYLIYGPLAVLGGLRMWRRRRRFPLLVLGGSLVSYWLPHVVYFGSIRMRMATEFLLLMLAAYGVFPNIGNDPIGSSDTAAT